jgi:hypothetical protein
MLQLHGESYRDESEGSPDQKRTIKWNETETDRIEHRRIDQKASGDITVEENILHIRRS